jgi:hypothetical protein
MRAQRMHEVYEVVCTCSRTVELKAESSDLCQIDRCRCGATLRLAWRTGAPMVPEVPEKEAHSEAA